jgi:hypothetical protein
MGIVGAWIGALCYIVIFGVVIILRVRKGGGRKRALRKDDLYALIPLPRSALARPQNAAALNVYVSPAEKK